MENPYNRAAQNYKREAVQTMSPGEIIVALLNEAVKMLAYAKEHIISKNIQEKSNCLTKAKKIISYMAASLDMQYPISEELARLYEYYIWEIGQANIKNDTKKLDDLVFMVSEIRDGFKGAATKVAGENGIAASA